MSSIKCWECKGTHATVAEVKECHYAAQIDEAMAAAEAAAEMAAERFYEDGGSNGWMEAAAFEAWENARGVVQFHEAMAAADARAAR
jgi:hypothetical protein